MTKRIFAALMALLAAAALLAGCGKKDPEAADPTDVVVIDVTGEPTETGAAASPDATEPANTESSATEPACSESSATEPAVTQPADTEAASTPTAEPTPDATEPAQTSAPAPTQNSSEPPVHGDYGVFADCVFVGNSTFEGLYRYGVITNSTFFTRVGLNVNTVYTTSTSTGSVPVIDELNTGSYKAVILMFGQNECGWPSLDTFLSKYAQLLNDIWSRQPNAKIFITAVPPVSKAVSDEGPNGVTNEHINYINNGLEQLANRTNNAYYISVPGVMFGSDGALRPEASGGDGIHLNLTYTKYWADHIRNVVASVIG